VATFEITSPDGKRFEVTAPDGATQEQVLSYAQSQFNPPAKFGENMADRVPGQSSDLPVGPQRVTESKAPKALNIFAPAEGALSLATGAVGGIAGMIAGAGKTILAGPNATPEDVQKGKDLAQKVSSALTYQPRSELAQDQMGQLSTLLRESKLAGLPPAGAITLGGLAGPAAGQARNVVANARSPAFLMPTPEPQMVGMGAATTAVPAMRVERAASLPVPINLTKGQATRTFDQVQFEREAAKNPTIGAPLRDRFATQNEQILQNFDAWTDQTGAQAPSLRATGEVVTQAIVDKANRANNAINLAYEKARESGAMAQKVNVESLYEYLEKNKPQSINAGVIGSTRGQLNQLIGLQRRDTFGQPIAREISINDLEEIRKQVSAASTKDGPNSHFGKEIRTMIDQLTEGKGGDDYKYARRLRTQYGNEFENIGIIDRLMSTKPGTRDRSVAYEDVFSKSILGGSLDDVRAVRKTLQTAGPQGQQAWKELQGQTVKYLKEEVTKSAQLDQRGNSVVSAHRLNALVTELDKDGKLDFIFGKQGSQQIRDINDIAKDVLTAPPGSINTSNTASILIGLLDTAISGTTGLPLPVGTAIHQGAKYVGKKKMQGRVAEALSPQR
jgi:hypothetical protein